MAAVIKQPLGQVPTTYYANGGLRTEGQQWGDSGRKLTLYFDNGKPHYIFEFNRVLDDGGKPRAEKRWRKWDRDGKLLEDRKVE